MLIWIPVAIVAIAAVLAILISMQPKTFRVTRSVVIATPVDIPFGIMNDFHNWPAWSPFEKLDPNMQRTYAGAPSGVGAKYAWEGNREAGKGTMEILKSVPNSQIAIDLYFEKPFKARNATEFGFATAPNGASVSWTMSGNNTTMGKAMSLVMNMDKWLGSQFEEGLANVKRESEKAARGV